MIDLPAIRARAEAATPGPWSLQESNQGGAILLRGLENDNRLRRHPQSHLQVVPEADAVFVAHAREDVPALLAEVERLRGEVARLGLAVTHEGPEVTKRVMDRAIAARPVESPRG